MLRLILNQNFRFGPPARALYTSFAQNDRTDKVAGASKICENP
jgi:hypothetical protein